MGEFLNAHQAPEGRRTYQHHHTGITPRKVPSPLQGEHIGSQTSLQVPLRPAGVKKPGAYTAGCRTAARLRTGGAAVCRWWFEAQRIGPIIGCPLLRYHPRWYACSTHRVPPSNGAKRSLWVPKVDSQRLVTIAGRSTSCGSTRTTRHHRDVRPPTSYRLKVAPSCRGGPPQSPESLCVEQHQALPTRCPGGAMDRSHGWSYDQREQRNPWASS